MLGLFLRCVLAPLRRPTRARPDAPGQPLRGGAVSSVPRFGDALNLNVHFHCLVIDGVYGAEITCSFVSGHDEPQ